MKSTYVLSSTAALVLLLSIGRNASAQDAPPEVAPPPPPPVASGAVLAVAAPGQPSPAYYAPGGAPPPPADDARFRFGFDIGGGYTFAASRVGPSHGSVFNFGLRFGIQFNDPWAVYMQSNILLGSTAGGPAFSWSHGIIAEYTLANILHLGLGPSLALVAADMCTNRNRLSCADGSGTAVDITGRLAATFGVSRPNRRRAISLGLDLHPTFTSSGMFLFYTTLSAGYEAF